MAAERQHAAIELPEGSWWDWDVLAWGGDQFRLAAGFDLIYHHGLELVFTAPLLVSPDGLPGSCLPRAHARGVAQGHTAARWKAACAGRLRSGRRWRGARLMSCRRGAARHGAGDSPQVLARGCGSRPAVRSVVSASGTVTPGNKTGTGAAPPVTAGATGALPATPSSRSAGRRVLLRHTAPEAGTVPVRPPCVVGPLAPLPSRQRVGRVGDGHPRGLGQAVMSARYTASEISTSVMGVFRRPKSAPCSEASRLR